MDYQCFKCLLHFRPPKFRVSCLVAHDEAQCCHYGEAQLMQWWDWDKALDYGIMDPDGFGRHDPTIYNAYFTKEEFLSRAILCTIRNMDYLLRSQKEQLQNGCCGNAIDVNRL